jgi:hypothetical protein
MSNAYQRLSDDLEDTPLFGSSKSGAKASSARSVRNPFHMLGAALLVAAMIGFYFFSSPIALTKLTDEISLQSSSKEQFDSLGRYIMRNYDETKPMANFLACLGGLWGGKMLILPIHTNYI